MSVSTSTLKGNASLRQTLIVGVGNPLLGDEAIGSHIIENLSKIPLPADVCILDCGCDLLNLVSHIDKPRRIIIIDAIRAGGKPGQIHKFDLEELHAIQTRVSSAHQLQIVEILQLLKQAYPYLKRCKITIMGIEPGALELNSELSEEVNNNIANLTRLVIEEASLAPVNRQVTTSEVKDSKMKARLNLMT